MSAPWSRHAAAPGRLAPGVVTGEGLEMREPAWEAARQQLIRLLREQAVQYGPATLPSGTVTDVFVDTSRVTLLGDGLSLIESLLVPLLANDHVDAVGGPAMGAIPLVTLMARHQGTGFCVWLRELTPGWRPAIHGTPPATGHVGRPAR